VRRNNIRTSAGMLQENDKLYLTTVDGLVKSKGEIEDIVVDVVNGTPVRVRDLAVVEAGEKPVYTVVTANGRPAVLVNVGKTAVSAHRPLETRPPFRLILHWTILDNSGP
jgi:multidrug efflux pump subunit AcrB